MRKHNEMSANMSRMASGLTKINLDSAQRTLRDEHRERLRLSRLIIRDWATLGAQSIPKLKPEDLAEVLKIESYDKGYVNGRRAGCQRAEDRYSKKSISSLFESGANLDTITNFPSSHSLVGRIQYYVRASTARRVSGFNLPLDIEFVRVKLFPWATNMSGGGFVRQHGMWLVDLSQHYHVKYLPMSRRFVPRLVYLFPSLFPPHQRREWWYFHDIDHEDSD